MDRLLPFEDDERIGTVCKVDSYSVTIHVPDEQILHHASVNGLVILHTSDPNTRLIGRIDRVIRIETDFQSGSGPIAHNEVYVNALGTLKGAGGGRERPLFSRAVEKLPEIGADCFLLDGQRLAAFTHFIAHETAEVGQSLVLGSYAIASEAPALLNGNAFFQRHAMVVGSTGSGKSWAVACLIEQVANLPSANIVVFDLHGEYQPLTRHPHIAQYRIAGPGDLGKEDQTVLYLPYWLLDYEDMLAIILDGRDENAPNQAMAFRNAVIKAKQNTLHQYGMTKELETFTIDSPVPYDIREIVDELKYLNTQKVDNSTNHKVNGPFYGKFNRFIPRLEAKIADRRYGFLFQPGKQQGEPNYLEKLVFTIMHGRSDIYKGVKVIDFSQVPSDILPTMISLVAKLIFLVQQWSGPANRHPITLVCEEAHVYIPAHDTANAAESRAIAHFLRIAKEGRKYGISLLIISQRPAELNQTISSQCHNIIAMRLTNRADKRAVTALLPENLGGIEEVLPTLGIGEAVVVGDACLLPSRIKVTEPEYKPDSMTMRFWDVWQEPLHEQRLHDAVTNLRRQTTS